VREKRNRIRRSGYRLTREQYDAMLIDQCGRCAICEVPCDLRIDHNHQLKMVRELLCHQCNLTVGWLEKDSLRVQLAREYLSRHTKQ
jgi:Fe-S oxidoreductase